jgi:hypothetical protein
LIGSIIGVGVMNAIIKDVSVGPVALHEVMALLTDPCRTKRDHRGGCCCSSTRDRCRIVSLIRGRYLVMRSKMRLALSRLDTLAGIMRLHLTLRPKTLCGSMRT